MRSRVAKKVLVVEDNELNLKLFCDLLRAHGYAASRCATGARRWTRPRAFAPDLIVMDIQMPHVTGYELIVELKADEALAPDPGDGGDRLCRARRRGADPRRRGRTAYVSKPISLARFMEAVNGLRVSRGCERRRRRRSVTPMPFVPSLSDRPAGRVRRRRLRARSVDRLTRPNGVDAIRQKPHGWRPRLRHVVRKPAAAKPRRRSSAGRDAGRVRASSRDQRR